MNRFVLNLSVICFIIIINISCNKLLCGTLDKEHQNLIDSVNIKFKDYFSVVNVPCEYNYIKLELQTSNMDSTLIEETHKILYDPIKKIGWPTIIIYDNNGNYIISHSKNNKFFYQSGD